jgi:predicted DNA-binding transcriptional regulator YafY
MQSDRLFEIIYILMNKDRTTAAELAVRFEVSVRTVYRDIDALCRSGIPVCISKGKGGGISLLPGFVLNKSFLSQVEQSEIISALQGLQAIKYPDAGKVLSKLAAFFGETPQEWIDVDFSDWTGTQKERFRLLKEAVIKKNVIAFDYFSSKGEKSHREVEPLQLWFKERTWYIKAFCRSKREMRLFKVSRMKNLALTGENFDRILTGDPPDPMASLHPEEAIITIWVDESLAYRVYDEFEEEDIQLNEDGSFTVTMRFVLDEWVLSYLLSFGSSARVLSPSDVKEKVGREIRNMAAKYE